MRDYFPLGKASGKAFCNRIAETQWLVNNIQACKHSLIIAPRRFGKSSLAERAIEKCRYPTVGLNFNTCADEEDVDALIRQGVSNLIGKAIGPLEKSMQLIKHLVRHVTPKINLGTAKANLELTVNNHAHSPAVHVEETLSLVENLLKNKKRRAVILFDEFQTVGLIAKSQGVEAAIRNMAQNMQHLVILFSGSNRSLLQSMFDDQGRPLYKICRKLQLERISETHYKQHLNKAAKQTWETALTDEAFNAIMLLSERHPYYVNYLCDILWTSNKGAPDEKEVQKAWLQVIEEEYSDANAEISSTAMAQRKILRHIANQSGENLLAASSVSALNLPLSTAASAINGLVEKDMIEKVDAGYMIINPIIKHLLRDSVESF